MVEPKVAVLMGSDSDLPKLQGTIETLREFGIPFSVQVLSAHRTPKAAQEFAESAESKGYQVIIAAAGAAAHLAGVLASMTTLPVIGIPIPTPNLGGLDSLLSMVQMPSGVPVATVATGSGGATNAAVLAVQILALSDSGLRNKLQEKRQQMAKEVAAKSKKVQEELGL